MKITGSGSAAGAGQRRKVSGRGGESSAASFAEHVSARSAAGSGVPSTTPLAALDGVVAVQGVPGASQERRQAGRRGHGLLDDLHQLQIGMVEGWVSEGTLRRLAWLVDRRRPALTDPNLDAVRDEIEFRAAVELAKLTRGPA